LNFEIINEGIVFQEINISRTINCIFQLKESWILKLIFLGILVVETVDNFSKKLNFIHVSTQKDFYFEEASLKGFHHIFGVPIEKLLG